MTESVFETRKLQEIYDEIKKLYQSDDRPWILGFSGGKDSTCMAQLVWNAIGQLEQEKRTKEIYIIGCDTLVESPKIVERLRNTLDDMKEEAKEQSAMEETKHTIAQTTSKVDKNGKLNRKCEGQGLE